MIKKRGQFPFRSPNLETALSDELSGAMEKGKWSLTISNTIIENITDTKIIAEIPNVFHKLSGFFNPKSFQETALTFILQLATIKVVADQKSPFAIPNFGYVNFSDQKHYRDINN